MGYPVIRLVFDRKHVSNDKDRKGLVQLEVYHDGKRKWYGTGVKLLKKHWRPGAMAVGFLGSTQVNERLMAMMGIATGYVNDLIRHGRPFDFSGMDHVLRTGSGDSGSFVAFMQERIDNRRDITDGTLRHHKVVLSAIGEFGRIFLFDDLTARNIRALDDWLRVKGIKETTVYNYHKIIKSYVHEAIRYGMMDEGDNPYKLIRVKRGKAAERVTLTVDELDRLKTADIPDRKVSRVRDLFVFQCVTGLSYADMATLDMGRSATDIGGGRMLINGRRVKTGEDYTVVLLPSAVEILDRYDWRLPIISNQKYNDYLKLATHYAGIRKTLTSHCGRHTFATIAINNGVPVEVVSRILGHTSIKTTQIYAKVLSESVRRGFDKLSGLF